MKNCWSRLIKKLLRIKHNRLAEIGHLYSTFFFANWSYLVALKMFYFQFP